MNYAERRGNTAPRKRRTDNPPDWRHGLPADWHEQVIAPLDIVCHTEYEMPASRSLGRDEDGRLCFYEHHFRLEETRSDDDEDYYRALAYAETVRAWRLRDDRWLIYRQQHHGDDRSPRRGFFALSESPPEGAR